ncbi:hypothetical protein BJ986_001432 [Phycicoccus badiiscoriae]|uniref:Serine/threonine protein kinase n=1 Tax=Pedococcus badiiscoriae TaxID=642776 RepID=A0A852WL67_9MICO|nr:hypothetical protein [Pedococcus badiiscoriae]NYG06945.1 hypothetical protein [Pedococcus badiiscoriae]
MLGPQDWCTRSDPSIDTAGGSVHGVGPSTVLGGRYAVQRRIEQLPRAERWSAADTTLERDVVIVCFAEDETHAEATLDAARRVAGLDNHRLVRVLDVGRSDGIAFFVEEAIHDAHSLAQILQQGGLPAEEVRRIVGETATGLEAARGRGLHHLRLTPHSVLRDHDGTIKVRGVATLAAMAAEDDLDATQAARVDAIGVVALTYAALTSRWPLPGSVAGVESAPRVVGGVPAPSEIAAGVPGDLDALCRLTLNEDQGPLTPGDFASQIAPWATAQVNGVGRTTPVEDGMARTIALPMDELRAELADQSGKASGIAAETVLLPAVDSPRPAAAAPATGSTAPRFDPLSGPAAHSGVSGAAGAAGAAGVGGQADPAAPGSGEPGAGAAAAAQAAAAASAVGAALGTAGQVAGQAAGAAAQRVGSFARAAADKAAERRAMRQAAEERADQRRISLDEALVEGAEPLDPPLPLLLPAETGAPPTRDQSKFVLAIVAAFLILAIVVGFYGASKIGSNTNLGLGNPPAPRGTVKVTAPAVTVTPTQPGALAGSGGQQTFPILGATGFDPEGDGAERNGEAPRVFDGKDTTFWSSEGYASAKLGGLKKGVGVRLDLGQARAVTTVKLVLPNPADVTVYVGDDPRSLSSAKEVGSSQGKSGEVVLKAPAPVKGQYVFVWFTSVSQVSDGRFRATLAEVTVS